MKDLHTGQEKTSALTKICMVAFFLSNISYLPFFANSGVTQLLSIPAWGLIGIAILFRSSLFLSRRDIGMICFLMTAACLICVFQLFTGRDYFGSLLTKCVFIAIVVSFVGEMVAASGETYGQERKLFISYIIATAVLCAVVYFSYLQGQDLADRQYVYTSKNETAFLAVTSIILLLFWGVEKDGTWLKKAMRVVLAVLLVAVIVLMRCRSMLLCVPVILATYLFQRSSSRPIKILIVVAVTALLIAMQNDTVYDTVVNQILFAGRETNDVNDISSGRMDQIRWALEEFGKHPWVGTGNTATVDCFYVSVLMQYGVILGAGLIILSIYPAVWGYWYYKKTNSKLGLILTLCSACYIIGGFFEENAPYGPGTRCYLMWFLWGYLKMYDPIGSRDKRGMKV